MADLRLLLVDDDPELRSFLRQELQADGYHCEEAASGSQAIALLREQAWQLVILDWSLPDFSGVDVCRRLRESDAVTPVLMLTAHDDVKERVEALDAGADDYLTKPFSLDELMARVRARLRRVADADSPNQLIYADLVVDLATHDVQRGGCSVQLTAKEFDLLLVLIRQPAQVQTRDQIMGQVWGFDWIGDPGILDVYIRSLRKKIEVAGCPTLIQTVRGVGFLLKQGVISP
ncbi:MAG: response regulator transcription factor [Vulcanococcus sp.]